MQKINNATFTNADMKNFVELAQSSSPNFLIVQYGGVPLVILRHDSHEQIVFPSFGGFQMLSLEEYHGSSLLGHLSTLKSFELLH